MIYVCYNFLIKGVIIIRVNNKEYRNLKKRHDTKECKRKKKKKKHVYKIKLKRQTDVPEYKVFNVPKIFSIIDNPTETIGFFNLIINVIEKIRNTPRKYLFLKYTFKINMDLVEKITGDALMYLRTVIRNTREKKFLPVIWNGTFSQNEGANNYLKKSGFLNYMETDSSNLMQTSNKLQIATGKNWMYKDKNKDKDIRIEVAKYTMKKLNKTKQEVKFLFNILNEIVTNIEHAYDEELIFEPSWYIMVENEPDKIKYTFMDNGLGIPTTVKKRTGEKVMELLNLNKEYKYISTGLDGSYKRTQTEQIERGTGLPDLYEKYKNKQISNLVIISNKGYYKYEESEDLDESVVGTIIYWEIEKEI